MKTFLLLVFGVIGYADLCFAQVQMPSPSPAVPAMLIGDSDKTRVLKSLKERIQREERDLEVNEKNTRKDLVKAQSDRRREWRDKERKARRAYFEAHGSGPERRAYVQDFVKRKKDFDYHEKVEWSEFKHRQKEARETLMREHRSLSERVHQSLSNQQIPDGF
jgi:hypothetical protein